VVSAAIKSLAFLPTHYQRSLLSKIGARADARDIAELLETDNIINFPPKRPEPTDYEFNFSSTGSRIKMGARIDRYCLAAENYTLEKAKYDFHLKRSEKITNHLIALDGLVDEINMGLGADIVHSANLFNCSIQDLHEAAFMLANRARDKLAMVANENKKIMELAFAEALALPVEAERIIARAKKECDLKMIMAKNMTDEHWQRRRLKKSIKRTRVQLDAVLGRVGSRPGQKMYASGDSVKAWRGQQQLNEKWAADNEIVDALGNKISLAQIIKTAARSKLSQTYSIVLGLEEIMARRGWKPFFLTLTLPPKWHPSPKDGKRSWRPECGPVAGRVQIGELWQRVRERWGRANIKPVGLWIKEPHADACVHMHALIWVDPDDEAAMRQAIKDIFPGENQAQIKEIDLRGGRGASIYVFKYLVKSLNDDEAASLAADNGGGDADTDHLKHFDAVRAFASDTGCRRWGFVGLRSGTLTKWKLAYSASRDLTRPKIGTVTNAMRRQNWAQALLGLDALHHNDKRPARVALLREKSRTGYVYTGVCDMRTGEAWSKKTWKIQKVRCPNQLTRTVVLSEPRLSDLEDDLKNDYLKALGPGMAKTLFPHLFTPPEALAAKALNEAQTQYKQHWIRCSYVVMDSDTNPFHCPGIQPHPASGSLSRSLLDSETGLCLAITHDAATPDPI